VALTGVAIFLVNWGDVRAQVERHERVVKMLGTPSDPLYPLMRQQSTALEAKIEGVETKVEANGEDMDDLKRTVDTMRRAQTMSTEKIIRAIGRLEGKMDGVN